MWIENSELFNVWLEGERSRQCKAIDHRLIMRAYFRFTHGCVLHYTQFTYVSSTAGPTLRVIMARICVTRNTDDEYGRETDAIGGQRGNGARTPQGERKIKKKKEKEEEAGACECFAVHGATITRSAGWLIAFISREDVADTWVDAGMRPRTSFFYHGALRI